MFTAPPYTSEDEFQIRAAVVVIEYIMTVRETPRVCKKNGGGIITVARSGSGM